MPEYRGFISWDKYQELCNILGQMVEVDGLRNKLDHLYSPDTGLDDKICENLLDSQYSIMHHLCDIAEKCRLLADKIIEIKEA